MFADLIIWSHTWAYITASICPNSLSCIQTCRAQGEKWLSDCGCPGNPAVPLQTKRTTCVLPHCCYVVFCECLYYCRLFSISKVCLFLLSHTGVADYNGAYLMNAWTSVLIYKDHSWQRYPQGPINQREHAWVRQTAHPASVFDCRPSISSCLTSITSHLTHKHTEPAWRC